MAAKVFAFVCCLAVFNVMNIEAIALPSNLLPNQVFLNSPQLLPTVGPTFLPTGPNVVVDLPGYGLDAVYTAPVTVPATTTIIQDSTVANNLANALQLLIVSNLLSTTLPSYGGCADAYVPGYGAVDLVAPALSLPYGGLPVAGLPAGYTYVY